MELFLTDFFGNPVLLGCFLLSRSVPGNVTTFATDEPLFLNPGTWYKMGVVAVNGAGVRSSHYTDGVRAETSPPEVRISGFAK